MEFTHRSIIVWDIDRWEACSDEWTLIVPKLHEMVYDGFGDGLQHGSSRNIGERWWTSAESAQEWLDWMSTFDCWSHVVSSIVEPLPSIDF